MNLQPNRNAVRFPLHPLILFGKHKKGKKMIENIDCSKEIWKAIEGYEGLYEVSNLGRVRSVDRVIPRKDGKKKPYKGVILSTTDLNGYAKVVLSKNGNLKTHRVCRLVGIAFQDVCGIWFDGAEINHKDENTHNDNADNLEWCTKDYNLHYGTCRQRCAINTRRAIALCDLNGNIILSCNSRKELAARLGINPSTICSSIARKGIWQQKYQFVPIK